ncbi:hypothetical protein [Microlunatus speluncae]|uniref:hypothetical protein n=1 Tax=Microlunatus speluncae TaxID=2594267 RepID=UPI0012660942
MIKTKVTALLGGLALLITGAGCSGLSQAVSSTPEGCLIRTGDNTVGLDLEQAKYASIIAGLSVRRSLPARAASVALATAYQESGIRNIDYGDRDSVGLFQQRPSQDWGTVKQIMDPYYSTGEFYDALVKIKNWEERDITEVAQAVQISAYPDAYRDHEEDGKALASTLTGHSQAAVTCYDETPAEGDAKGLAAAVKKTFGKITVDREGTTLTIDASSNAKAWAYGQFALASLDEFGVATVTVADQIWRVAPADRGEWVEADAPAKKRQVIITVR